MVKRMIVLGIVAVAVTAAPAAAQQYPPDEHIVEVDAAALCPGDPLTVQAQTFVPGSTVDVVLVANDVILGTTTANESGVATFSGPVPDDQQPGDYLAQVSGTGADGQELVLSASIEIQECPLPTPAAAAPAAPAGDLPVTGSNVLTLLGIGLALAALGGLLLALTNRRRRAVRAAHLKTA